MSEINHWLMEYLTVIKQQKNPPIVLNAGKTSSGTIHIGIMRELLINDGLFRLLSKEGIETKFTLFIDDFDAAKHFPSYIPKDYHRYQGVPFCSIPDPFGCHNNYAEHFASEFTDQLPEFYLDPEIIYTSQIYKTKPMKDAIRQALLKVEIIRDIYLEYILPTLNPQQQLQYPQKMKTWFPAMVVCPKCGRVTISHENQIMVNRVTAYDAENDLIKYYCHSCETEASEPLTTSQVKLTWRVDWPAKWSVYKVSAEPAGKDHAVKGGAYDTGLAISQRVFDYPGPIKIAYEWLRFGDRDMKTHKGIVFTPEEYLKLGYPEALRYLLLQTIPGKAISFRPEFFPQLVDSFIQLETSYFSDDQKHPDLENPELVELLYPLCLKGSASKTPPNRLPYRFAMLMTQLEPVLGQKIMLEKSVEMYQKVNTVNKLSDADYEEIKHTLTVASYWIDHYAPSRDQIKITTEVSQSILEALDQDQIRFLQTLQEKLPEFIDDEEQTLQNKIFKLGTANHGLSAKKTFQAVYLALFGQPFGPRLAPLLKLLDQQWVVSRLSQIVSK